MIIGMIYMYLLYALVCSSVTSTSGETLSWKLDTVPAVFGEDVQLSCFISNYTSRANMNRRWSIRRNIHGITLNGISRYPYKYSEHMDKKIGVSTLRIHNFSLHDVNIIYECAYGFLIDRKMLILSKFKFEKHPQSLLKATVETDTECTCRGNVTLENVFPQPYCKSTLNKKDVTLPYFQVNTEKRGLFFTTDIKLVYTHRDDVEMGKWIVVCDVGSKRIVVINETMNCTLNGTMETRIDIQRVAGILSVCFLMSIPFMCLMYVLSKNNNTKLLALLHNCYQKKRQGPKDSLKQHRKTDEEMALQNDVEGVT